MSATAGEPDAFIATANDDGKRQHRGQEDAQGNEVGRARAPALHWGFAKSIAGRYYDKLSFASKRNKDIPEGWGRGQEVGV
jgi:hypothetical protein